MARPRTLLPVALAVVAAGALPAGAAASTVVKTAANAVQLSGGPGENNNVNVTVAGPEIVLVDTAGLTQTSGCIQQNPTTVRCAKADVTEVSLAVGDGDNAVTTGAPYPTVVSGAGATKNDFKVLHSAGSTLQGSEARDELLSRAGNDTLNGAGGDDRLVPGLGADVVQGGAGRDSVSFSERSAAVNVTLDGLANDGEAGETDLVGVTVEQVFAGTGKDTLRGDAKANAIYGGAGPDRISGGAGDDDLRGDAGDDRITGEGGVDQLNGGPDADRLEGNAGEDVLAGLGGADDLRGGSDDDSITGGDGGDRLQGGRANDVMRGEGDDDTLRADIGSDVLDGGGGTDTADYSSYRVAVTLDLAGKNGVDGAVGERDAIDNDMENAIGGSAGDDLIGNGRDNSLTGGGGADTIKGGFGRDQLLGQGGRDALLSADDATDLVNCGGSRDRVSADPRDSVVACESRVAGLGTDSSTLRGPRVVVSPGRLRLTRRGVARLRLRCPRGAQTHCLGTLTLSYRKAGRTRKFRSRRFRIATGRTARIRVVIPRRVRSSFPRRGARVGAVANARDTISAPRTTRRTIRMRPAGAAG